MVKRKLAVKEEKQKDGLSILPKWKDFIKSSSTHYFVGVIVLAFAVYATIAMISFFFTGAADQSRIESGAPIEHAENWTGARGAILSNYLMNECFGLSMFFLLAFLVMAGLRLMKARYSPLMKSFIIFSLLTIWTSVALSFFFGWAFEESAVYIGGKHGLIVSDWLSNQLGLPGAFLVLVITFILVMILVTPKTIPFLNRLQASPKWGKFFKWTKRDNSNKKPKTKKEPVQKDEEEDFVPLETKTTILVVEDQNKKEPFVEENKNEDSFEVIIAPEDDYIEPKNDNPKPNLVQEEEPNELVEELGLFDPTLDLAHYNLPSLDLLKKYDIKDNQIDMEEQNENKNKIIQTLEKFSIRIKTIKATVGPTITLYEIVPEDGVRISKIRNLEDDIAMSLAALGIRIIAPMPGKGTIGIEVPNKDPQMVSMHSIIASKKYQESEMELPLALGKTITNEVFMVDLAKLPHLLVAGATGQGKSVGLNAAITSLLYKKHPAELKFVLVDPKMVEFSIYSVIEKHFLAKLPDEGNAIITDFTKVVHTLNSLTKEMDDRYSLLNQAGVRNVKEYNDKFINRRLNPNKGHRFMPYIVVVIDEFGDLIMTAGKEIELPIARIAQKARAVGIHMVIATQRPTTNIITGTIKANFPARIAFRVMAMIDSRTILDSPGANQLIGRGDLLFTQGGDMVRVQCAFVDTPEVERISKFIGNQQGYPTAFPLPEYVGEDGGSSAPGAVDLSNKDSLFEEAARLIVIHQQGSTSLIQRKFQIGYNRAGRLMDQLEAAGIVGPTQGSKAREVYIPDEYHLEQLFNTL
ncbi:DNA translocase FtsK [Bacteroidales bacterium OttesenSCG-928-M11]|nr:DNA translocase FtsK [Bacteroidales bacterium OttesenSCG-928-M11]